MRFDFLILHIYLHIIVRILSIPIRFSIEARFQPCCHFYFWEARASGLFLQPTQPLPCIFNLSNTRVSVFPEVEELLVMFLIPSDPSKTNKCSVRLPGEKRSYSNQNDG